MDSFKNEIEEAISYLQEEINKKQEQISLLQTLTPETVLDEEMWHKLCETSLRGSEILCAFVKNIFPDAEDIIGYANGVRFTLYGFVCEIPTSFIKCIRVDLSWYKKDCGEPSESLSSRDKIMKEYFEAKDNHAGWETLFNLRCPFAKGAPKYRKAISWFFYFKRKDDHREEWEKHFAEEKRDFEEGKKKYKEERQAMHDRTKLMADVLLPELKKFSTRILPMSNFQDIQGLLGAERIEAV